ncbi:MAG: methionyl-tRNA formyltransferase [Acidobacteriota bacterium]|jgi:methionyl-tRNA formyltransferase|nr:methionyl-tRNA formyltransferase [Acidobacteriota bacterium]
MKLIFMGTPESAVPALKRCVEEGHEVLAVWTQPDRPSGRGNRLKSPPVKEYALSKGLAVYQPSKIKTEEALTVFTAREFDLAVVVAYGRILPATFLRAPRRGCVNVHFSLLPKFRGAAPVNWAIVRGERVSGVTTMLMDEGLDTGPVLLQRSTQIGEGETAPQLLERLSHEGAELLAETLAHLDEIEPRTQSDADATLAPILRREDGLIDWTEDAFQIERRVRGFQPWPNAYTSYNGRRLIIWRAEPSGRETGGEEEAVGGEEEATGGSEEEATGGGRIASAGEIIEARGDELFVACGGETALKVLELQPEGKQRMRARDFINGSRVNVGEKFG